MACCSTTLLKHQLLLQRKPRAQLVQVFARPASSMLAGKQHQGVQAVLAVLAAEGERQRVLFRALRPLPPSAQLPCPRAEVERQVQEQEPVQAQARIRVLRTVLQLAALAEEAGTREAPTSPRWY